ncbi:hypothetical protein GGP93_000260 [Salinibacter ruber]|nr:hypothetical protein [Salinibacter ruber]
MLKTKSFPSVFETNTTELVDVADGLLEGLKVQVDDEQYVVGDLALREGTAPTRASTTPPPTSTTACCCGPSFWSPRPAGPTRH